MAEYDNEQWLQNGAEGAEEELKEKYRFFMRPDPAQRRMVGPIHTEFDELTGRTMRWREARIGMMRGASDESLKTMKVFLDPFPHVRIEAPKMLQGWYADKTSESGRNRPRPCFSEAILTQPFGGSCGIFCKFCYINSGNRGYRGSGLATVPINYGEFVRKTLAKLKTASAGYFSSFSEPFQPLEDYYGNSQQGAQAFVDNGLPIFFLSRLRYPDWAIEQLKQNPYSYAQKSLNTPDPAIWAKLSPGALPLAEHFKDIRRLKKAGIYVSIQVNPILPGIMEHKDIVRLIEKLGAAGADHVIVKFVETAYPWAPAMIAAVGKGFGAVARERFASLFTQNIGGQRTVDEEYRVEGHRLYQAAATRVGMTYSLCYEFKYARSADGSIINKVGVSMGPDFMTSDQCHGRRVPLYSREDLSKPFQEVKQCPPAGCLTCADGRKTGLGRCGSPLYSAARALTLAELKHSVREKGPIKTGSANLIQIGGGE